MMIPGEFFTHKSFCLGLFGMGTLMGFCVYRCLTKSSRFFRSSWSYNSCMLTLHFVPCGHLVFLAHRRLVVGVSESQAKDRVRLSGPGDKFAVEMPTTCS